MTERETLYQGISRVAWGYLFLYIDINLGQINVMPAFVAYLLFLSAIACLKQERRDLMLLRPLGIFLALWNGGNWLAAWAGTTLEGQLIPLDMIVTLAGLYFHFQLLTDIAGLAAQYQEETAHLDSSILKWRTIQTLLLTALPVADYLRLYVSEWWGYVAVAMVIFGLITGVMLMITLFCLRKVFREQA